MIIIIIIHLCFVNFEFHTEKYYLIDKQSITDSGKNKFINMVKAFQLETV